MDAKPWYAVLKKYEPEAYRKAVEYASALEMRHNLGTKIAADIETTLVMFACECFDIHPVRGAGPAKEEPIDVEIVPKGGS